MPRQRPRTSAPTASRSRQSGSGAARPLANTSAESAAGRRARSSLRHPPPPAAAERIDWEFRAADIDVAGHVNNAVYWQIAEQHLPAAAGGVEIEIEFRGGAVIGTATLLRQGGILWVLDREGSVSASVSTRPLDRQASPGRRQTEEESE